MQHLVLPVLFLASALQPDRTAPRELGVVHLQRVAHCGTNLDVVVFPSGAVYEGEEDGCVIPKSELRLHYLRPERIAEILRLVRERKEGTRTCASEASATHRERSERPHGEAEPSARTY